MFSFAAWQDPESGDGQQVLLWVGLGYHLPLGSLAPLFSAPDAANAPEGEGVCGIVKVADKWCFSIKKCKSLPEQFHIPLKLSMYFKLLYNKNVTACRVNIFLAKPNFRCFIFQEDISKAKVIYMQDFSLFFYALC